jgi:Sulfotransferase family
VSLRLRPRRRYDPSAGLPFDDEELESRLVWIWTSARSGSTWLLRMLVHPLRLVDGSQDPSDALGFRAPDRFGPVDVIPVDTTFLANHLAPLARDSAYDEAYVPVTFGMYPGMANRPNYFFSLKYADVWRPEVRRLALVRFHGLIERTAEHHEVAEPRVILKEVAGAHAADLIMSLFPRSRLVFLLRDGRDVVDSQVDANRADGWLPTAAGYASDEERLEFVRERARSWVGDVATIQRAFAAHPQELRYEVRYEDLLADTSTTLGALVEWLGFRRGPHWLERTVESNSFARVPPDRKGPGKFLRAASPGLWRESLSPAEQEVLHEVMGDKLAELGYRA